MCDHVRHIMRLSVSEESTTTWRTRVRRSVERKIKSLLPFLSTGRRYCRRRRRHSSRWLPQQNLSQALGLSFASLRYGSPAGRSLVIPFLAVSFNNMPWILYCCNLISEYNRIRETPRWAPWVIQIYIVEGRERPEKFPPSPSLVSGCVKIVVVRSSCTFVGIECHYSRLDGQGALIN